MDDRLMRIVVGGNLSGNIIIGDNNVVVNYHGTTVAPARPPVVKRITPPRSLPFGVRDAPLGLDAEHAAVHRHLDSRLHVQVHGPAGYGKSLLVNQISRERDGHVICLAGNGQPVDDLVQAVFEACYECPRDYRPTLVELRRLLAPVRAVLVLDDFSDDPRDVEFVLDTVTGCTVLVASRQRTLFSAGRAVELGALSDEASIALVRRVLGREPTPAEMRQVRAANGSPPALLRVGTTPVDDRKRRILRVLAVLGGTACSIALIVLLSGVASADADPALAELERVGLVSVSGNGFRLATEFREAQFDEVADAAQVASALTEWLWRGPFVHEVAEAAPVIVAVLRAAGATPEALRLARVAAPALLQTLRLGSWGQVLEFGASVATVLDAADELGYFRHELQVRQRLLTEPAPTRVLWKVLTPLLVIALLLGGSWMIVNARGGGPPGAQPPPSTPSTAPTSGVEITTIASTVSKPTGGQPTAPPPPCTVDLPAVRQFDGTGDATSVPILAKSCHTAGVATGQMSIDGANADAFALDSDCPPVLAAGKSCSPAISFVAKEPGTYSARFVIPGAGSMTLKGLIGKAPPDPTTTTTTPTSNIPTPP